MLCNVKRPDDMTTDESNPLVFDSQYWIDSPIESIITSSIVRRFRPLLYGLLLAIQRLDSEKAADIAASWRLCELFYIMCKSHYVASL